MKRLAALALVLVVALAPVAVAQQYPPQECPGNSEGRGNAGPGECPGNSGGNGNGSGECPGNSEGRGNAETDDDCPGNSGARGSSTARGGAANVSDDAEAVELPASALDDLPKDQAHVVLGSREMTTLQLGQVFTFEGSGFEPGELVHVTLESTPLLVATPTASQAGAIAVQIRVPADFPPGRHTLRAVGQRSGWTITAPLEIVAASRGSESDQGGLPGILGDLPQTGAGVVTLTALGLASLAVGIVAVGRSRRKLTTG